MTVTVRLMQPDDISECARWIADTPLWKRYGVTAESIAARLGKGLDKGATIFVAEAAGEVLGFLWFVERGAFNRSGYVQLVGVRPGARGQGIGRTLMEYAEAQSAKLARDMFLLVSDFNTDAQRFYEGLGYRQVGRLDDYVLPGIAELVYRKRL